MMDVRREEWARPGGHGVVSGLNSILYQTHLYRHKQEACLLGRESTAIHFLSGCLADGEKLGQPQLWECQETAAVINTCCGLGSLASTGAGKVSAAVLVTNN